MLRRLIARIHEPVNSLTHLGGAVAGLVGLVALAWLSRADPAKMTSMIVYGVSLVLLFTASASLHTFHGSPRLNLWLQRLDHAAIYLLIAGSYTPICYNVLSGHWRWGMLGTIWALAVAGVVYKLFFLRHTSHLSTAFYVGMGWLAVVALPKLLPALSPGALALMLLGGLFYSVGAVIFALERPNLHRHFGFHELWHCFVLAGSLAHFLVMLVYMVPFERQ